MRRPPNGAADKRQEAFKAFRLLSVAVSLIRVLDGAVRRTASRDSATH